ncbi:perlwapin-like [Nematolebias whitei]|uniref:perlwapin-like n=1 Tax=Nematolebias whitei TaxID=451745 RepID=UPI00189BA36E|nr:perlwapin-like [Nematolebias whitei]
MPKPGHCPKYFESFAPLKPCHSDRDCPGSDKCCVFDYGSGCAPPIFLQPGICPRGPLNKPPIAPQCDNDEDCSGDEKCCFNGCGHQCM